MKQPRAPGLDARRAADFDRELTERARAWIPGWSMEGEPLDFGRALMKIAARFASEVSERLDRAGDKMRLGFLDWLAVQGEAARPARLPVVFKLSDTARNAVLAPLGTRLQVEVEGSPVILETEKGVNVQPRQLKRLVAVDADNDRFYLAPLGIQSLAPIEPAPTQWRLKSFAAAGAKKLQLDPETGLAKGMFVEVGGQQYELGEPAKDIVPIDPPLDADQPERALVTKVSAFLPFDGAARNQQQHILYLGHKELLDIESDAAIEILGAKTLPPEVTWEYFGKDPLRPDDEPDWHPLVLPSVDQQNESDALLRFKPKGKVEEYEVDKGKKSRWIRGRIGAVSGSDPLLRVDKLEIRVNCDQDAPPSATPPLAEAMANTTPLVLDSVFFPFGKEPRQFDAFYLGSTEAFSKKEAHVTLKFDMADTTFAALSALHATGVAREMLAGVARDGSLYVLDIAADGKISKLADRGPVRPPPGGADAASADVSAGVPLTMPLGRVPVWPDGTDPNIRWIAVSAGSAVWLRKENTSNASMSGWQPLGVPVISNANDAAAVTDLIYFADTKSLLALRGGELSRYVASSSTWEAVKQPEEKVDGESVPVELQAIVPVLVPSSGSLVTSAAAGMIGISKEGKLYFVQADGSCEALLPDAVSLNIRPVAVQSGDLFVAFAQLVEVAGNGTRQKPMLFQRPWPLADDEPGEIFEVKCAEAEAVTVGFEAMLSGIQVDFLASMQFSSSGYLLNWSVPVAEDPIEPFRADIPGGLVQPAGAPSVISGYTVVPATRGRVLSAKLDLAQRPELLGDVSEVVIAAGAPILAEDDVLVREVRPATQADAEKLVVRKIDDVGSASDAPEAFYVLKTRFDKAADGALHAFRTDDDLLLSGTRQAEADQIELDDDDHTTKKGSVILAKGSTAYRVTALLDGIATLAPVPPAGPAKFEYYRETEFSGRVSPSLSLNPANSIDRAKLAQATFFFKATKQRQKGKPLRGAAKVDLVELIQPWGAGAIPAKNAEFVLDASVGGWQEFLQDTATNPELSWEYWNGTGWWKLIVTNDETARLKVSGNLQFTVPTDIAPTDWSGRTNYWIRARLVGGDYGREEVSIKSSGTFGEDDFVQTVVRSTENIHAPSVAKLTISYSVCKPVLPAFVITQDSGTRRDQSDANRTGGAMVEAFVPIAALLRGLTAPDGQPANSGPCVPCCDGILRPTPADPAATATTGTGRALYLGFDGPLAGAPVNVLLLVQEERPNDAFAPLAIETLIADRFVPIVAHDATRALGESAILSLAFTRAPTQCELFGQTLTWLRLTPQPGGASADWKPTVLGAYLNAAWASATETLTYELVGSSQGEPGLKLLLARPPVLKDTLELRVREPLGEEELAALNAVRGDRVLSTVENLPGHWVLWDRVIDPDDESPDRRAYAFDEGTGEIRFGDGKHGRIPPVGRDCIMAFRYQRTERGQPGSVDVPANAITARLPLNLVSPIETVEAVFAADQAAGGAPAEDTERVLRFGVAGLRHRRRALTPADLEDLALQSSPRIAQARCFPDRTAVQLIVVMRGADPRPSAAQVRELQSFLLSRASPSLAAQDALRVAGPKVRRLRVDLRLRVASLDDAGEVAQAAKRALIAQFDTLTGGLDSDGWALGEIPAEADIAMSLAGVPRLEGIAQVTLREIGRDRSESAWPAALKRHELAMLDDDVMRVEFETVEVIA